MNIFSKEMETWLDKGFTVEQLLHITLDQNIILKYSSNIPITYIEDIDLYMLNNLPINDIKSMNQVNKYMNKLCNSRELWQQKMAHDKLVCPSLVNMININWMYVYQAAVDTMVCFEIIQDYEIYKVKDINLTILLNTLNKANIVVDKLIKGSIKGCQIHSVYLDSAYNMTIYYIGHVYTTLFLTKESCYDFMFHYHYNKN